jgi:hypothetical protein
MIISRFIIRFTDDGNVFLFTDYRRSNEKLLCTYLHVFGPSSLKIATDDTRVINVRHRAYSVRVQLV